MEHKALVDGDIIFNAKPDAVPYNYRISYKVSQICLIMRICCLQGCSLIKLHMISYALCTRSNMAELLAFANGETSQPPIVRFDPAVNKALTYSVAYGFILQQKTGNYKLTDKGKAFADRIQMADDLLVSEKLSLSELSKSLSEQKITELQREWRVRYVTD